MFEALQWCDLDHSEDPAVFVDEFVVSLLIA
jgi:hypothetical protein